MPYAAQAIGIATACVGGVGLASTGLVYAAGVDLKQQVEVSTVRDALQAANGMGTNIGARLKHWGAEHLWRLSPEQQSQAGDHHDKTSR